MKETVNTATKRTIDLNTLSTILEGDKIYIKETDMQDHSMEQINTGIQNLNLEKSENLHIIIISSILNC